jgi:hypothetical protein
VNKRRVTALQHSFQKPEEGIAGAKTEKAGANLLLKLPAKASHSFGEAVAR